MQTQINPYIYTKQLLQKYSNFYREYLKNYNFSPQDIDAICKNLGIDHEIQVSLNKKFQTSSMDTNALAQSLGWSAGLISTIPRDIEYFFKHQEQAFEYIHKKKNIIIATGTGSGKTESFIYPIIHECSQTPDIEGVQALIVYPMNALANDQLGRVEKILNDTKILGESFSQLGKGDGVLDRIKIGKITGENSSKFDLNNPPTILVTNIYMLERVLVTPKYKALKQALSNVRFVVFDEIHTYIGTLSNHVRYLIDRLKDVITEPNKITFIGASATLSTDEKDQGLLRTSNNQKKEEAVRNLGKHLFGVEETFIVESSFKGEDTLSDISPPAKPYNFEYLSDEPSFVDLFYTDHDAVINQIDRLLGIELSNVEKRHIKYGDQTDPTIQASMEKVISCLREHPIIRKMYYILFISSASLEELAEEIKPFITEKSDPFFVVEAFFGAISYFNEKSVEKPILDFRFYLFVKSLSGTLKRCINDNCCSYHNSDYFNCPQCGDNLYIVHKDDLNKYFVWEYHNELFANPNDSPKFSDTLVYNSKTDSYDLFVEDYKNYTVTFSSKNESILKATLKILSLMISLTEISNDSKGSNFHKILSFIDSRKKITQYTLESKDYFVEQLFLNIMILLPYSQYNINSLFFILDTKLKEILSTYQIKNHENIYKELPVWYSRYIKQAHKSREEFHHKLVSSFEAKDPLEQLFLNQLLEKRFIDLSSIKKFHNNIPGKVEKHSVFNQKDSLKTRAFYLDSESFKTHQEESKSSDLYLLSLDSQGEFVKTISEICRLDPSNKNSSLYISEFGGDKENDEFVQVFKKMVDKFLLLGENSPILQINNTPYYTLNPKYISLKEESLELLDMKKCDLVIEGHSSELEKDDRKRVEEDIIKSASFDLVFATSTLEMGLDIANLSQVVLVGIPPTPSNFVQRAGRAGRGKNLRYATIVSIGSDKSEHDMFYFYHPRDIISGHVRATAHKPLSETALKQHINAFILSYLSENFDKAQPFHFRDEMVDEILIKVLSVFNTSHNPEIEKYCKDYVKNHFVAAFNTAGVSLSNLQALYKHEIKQFLLPKYGFPDDTIPVYDINNKEENLLSQDAAEVTRLYHDEDIRYVSGKVYKVVGNPQTRPLSELGIPSDKEYYSHEAVYLQYDGDHPRASIDNHRMQTFFNDNSSERSDSIYLPINSKKTPLLTMRLKKKMPITFVSESKKGIYANQIKRDGILIEAPKKIMEYSSISILCLINAFEHYIKYNLGHSESEVGFLEFQPVDFYPGEKKSPDFHFYLYDKNNGETVNFKEILNQWEYHFDKMVQKIDACTCTDDHGCYLCLKSYSSQWNAAKITKENTKKFILILLARDKISLNLPSETPLIPQATLHIMGKYLKISIPNNRSYTKETVSNSNADIYTKLQLLLAESIQNEPNIRIFKVIGHAHIYEQILQYAKVNAGIAEFNNFKRFCVRENIKFIE